MSTGKRTISITFPPHVWERLETLIPRANDREHLLRNFVQDYLDAEEERVRMMHSFDVQLGETIR